MPALDTDFDLRRLPAGVRSTRWLAVAMSDEAGALEVPVLLAPGRAPGPRLALVGGVHGDEADGIATLYELWAQLDTATYSGAVMMIPVANPLAFRAGARRTPADGLDLNRVCPGRADGSPTERLAAALTRLLLANSDFLFTLHGWYATGVAAAHVEYDAEPLPAQAASLKACHAAGFANVVATDWPPGMLPKVAMRAGIPSMESEIGGHGTTADANVRFMLERIDALMRHLGMRDGTTPVATGAQTARRCVALNAAFSGVFRPAVEVGQAVVAGALLGRVHGLLGEPLQELRSPGAGVVLARRAYLSAAAEDNLFVILVTDGPTDHRPRAASDP